MYREEVYTLNHWSRDRKSKMLVVEQQYSISIYDASKFSY